MTRLTAGQLLGPVCVMSHDMFHDDIISHAANLDLKAKNIDLKANMLKASGINTTLPDLKASPIPKF
jgi:hypothetical protein